ncbi:MAG: glycosyltransferase [Parvularculaceae bacterium]|nr:glycosyltransferase [Parvularculaceae bacterium]
MILFAFALLGMLAWIYLAQWRAGFWRADERLPAAPAPAIWPSVAALIPARNEADGVEAVVRAHMAVDYPSYTVLLVDDGSTDGTADLAWQAGSKERLSIFTAPPLDAGWTGKIAAQRAGLSRLAAVAPAVKYVLLCDADIVLKPDTVRRLVAHAEANQLALASLMARLDSRGPFAGLLVPAFVYFFQLVYPFAASNDLKLRIAAAAGGCMLVRRDALAAAGGFDAIKGALIDDCALASTIKFRGPGAPRPIWIGLAEDEATSLRDNRSLGSVWSMVSRSAFAQLGYSWLALVGAVLSMALVYLGPPLVALLTPWHRDGFAGAAAATAWFIMTYTYRPTTAIYRLPWAAALTLPVAALFYMAMTVSSALAYARGKGGAWKGRTYAAPRRT